MDFHSQAASTQLPLLLPPKTASEFLCQRGCKIATATLAKLRCVGGGPSFIRFGRYVGYRPIDLIEWAKNRLSSPLHSTCC